MPRKRKTGERLPVEDIDNLTVEEMRERVEELDAEFPGQRFDDAAREEWEQLNSRIDELEIRRERVLELANDSRNHDGYRPDPASRDTRAVGEYRNAGLRAIERNTRTDVLTAQAADRLDEVVRLPDHAGLAGRYLAAVDNPDYGPAFTKILENPQTAHLRMTPKEQLAVQEVVAADQARTMSVGTTTAGGFGIPLQIDPTITLVGSGALNPVREFATVRSCISDTLRLVSSDGVVAAYAAELTAATDNSPTLAQPTIDLAKGQAWIPYSIEVGMDYPNLVGELTTLLADARAVVDATQFLSGSGTDAPKGVLTGLSSTSWRVQTTTTAVTAIGDIYALLQGVPARFRTSTVVAAHPTVWDIVYRFTGGNSAEPLLLADRGGPLLGKEKFEWSTMSTGTTTTGQKIMIAGDWKTGFQIADRIGATVEPVQQVFAGATPGPYTPIGARGLYFYWRTGSTVVSSTANAPLRWLEVK